jgi:hypothetical protein
MWVADPKLVTPIRRPTSWAGLCTGRSGCTTMAMACALKKVRRNFRSLPCSWAFTTWVRVMVAKSTLPVIKAMAASVPPRNSTNRTWIPVRSSSSRK